MDYDLLNNTQAVEPWSISDDIWNIFEKPTENTMNVDCQTLWS